MEKIYQDQTSSKKIQQDQTRSNKISQRNAKHKTASATCQNSSHNAEPKIEGAAVSRNMASPMQDDACCCCLNCGRGILIFRKQLNVLKIKYVLLYKKYIYTSD